MQCVVQRSGRELAGQVEKANTFFTRLAGLMFRRELAQGCGLLLWPCPQIHTWFMRFAIDAVFCDKKGTVLFVQENMKPWRWGRFVRGSYYTLELPGGSLQGNVQKGDILLFAENLNTSRRGEKK